MLLCPRQRTSPRGAALFKTGGAESDGGAILLHSLGRIVQAQKTIATTIAATTENKNPMRGIGMYILAVLMFSCLDTLTKLLAANNHYPVPFIAWVRYTVQFLLMTVILLPSMGRTILLPVRPVPVVWRSLSLVAATMFMGLAFQRLPLAEASAIVFIAPLLVVVLAKPFLGEQLTLGRAVLAVLGFTGVLLIARPSGQLNTLGVVSALLCALATTGYQLMSRTLKTEQPLVLLYNSALVGAVAFGLLAPFFWVSQLSATTLLMLLALGFVAGLGHFFLILSYRYAPASLVAPVSYLQLLFAGVLGWLVFHHIPDTIALIGMFIIAASGIANIVALQPK